MSAGGFDTTFFAPTVSSPRRVAIPLGDVTRRGRILATGGRSGRESRVRVRPAPVILIVSIQRFDRV